MFRLVAILAALVSLVAAQQINFKPGSTGTRSLWVSSRVSRLTARIVYATVARKHLRDWMERLLVANRGLLGVSTGYFITNGDTTAESFRPYGN